MRRRRTTRCCSAVALIVCGSVTIAAQSVRVSPLTKYDRTPLALFPVEPVWTLALNARVTVDPAFDADRAYFAIEDDRIVAYDIRSGEQSWIISAAPRSALTAGGGFLFFAETNAFVARHIEDGSLAWRDAFTETIVGRAVWSAGTLVVGTEGGSIMAARASDGHLLWRRDLASPVHAAPAIAEGRVYVSTTDGRIVALDRETGAPVWERRVGGSPNDILVRKDRLFVGSTDQFFYCLMTKDGRIDWRWRTGGNVIGMPAADDGHVYFVSLDNVLRAMHPVSGAQLWFRALPFRPAWGPVRAGSTIAVAGQASSVRTFAVKDGLMSGEVPAGGEVAAPLHVLEDPASAAPMLIVVTRDIAKGAATKLVTRGVEPALVPIAPLPNLITLSPALPRQP
ncbi:MAG: PQQ-binding-like beta-propeller repeat protein [Acidobacteria bacterium]|nr:PQQ-binding-like beta-propeller repeat protein [Acidobacteriota bacterium]